MTTVSFAELTHTGVAVDANNIPLAIGYIAAYAKTHLGNEIDAQLFKYPATLSKFLAKKTPTIAAFSNYMWNGRLSCTFAREIKRRHPNTIVVMGGPNYPVDVPEQQQYLEERPEIDFYIDGEGEMAFVGLFRALAGSRLRRRATQGQPHAAPQRALHGGWRVRSRRAAAADTGARQVPPLALHDGPPGRVLRRQAHADDPDGARVPVLVHVLPRRHHVHEQDPRVLAGAGSRGAHLHRGARQDCHAADGRPQLGHVSRAISRRLNSLRRSATAAGGLATS